jgi:lanosterol synthase
MQNPSGGYASYELQRGSEKMELLNAAEVFGNIMVDYLYPECVRRVRRVCSPADVFRDEMCVSTDNHFCRCTTSALSGLKYFSKVDPTYRAAEIERAVDKAVKWIHSVQRPDGSWYGSWGICFTYATMFALESLAIAGETYSNSSRVRRACEFLVSKQMEDGGWGETYLSCVNMEYSQHDQSQVVMTSWAILALLYAQYPEKEVIRRACRLVMSRQKKDGRWEQEDTEGIFNKNCAIDYPCESGSYG